MPEWAAWDVAYVGVVPEERGRGYGREIMHKALAVARADGVARLTLSVDARNLFGARFNSTGFPDPAGSPLVYYFPAARRVLTVGLESGW